jgi:hypothetical protein
MCFTSWSKTCASSQSNICAAPWSIKLVRKHWLYPPDADLIHPDWHNCSTDDELQEVDAFSRRRICQHLQPPV